MRAQVFLFGTLLIVSGCGTGMLDDQGQENSQGQPPFIFNVNGGEGGQGGSGGQGGEGGSSVVSPGFGEIDNQGQPNLPPGDDGPFVDDPFVDDPFVDGPFVDDPVQLPIPPGPCDFVDDEGFYFHGVWVPCDLSEELDRDPFSWQHVYNTFDEGSELWRDFAAGYQVRYTDAFDQGYDQGSRVMNFRWQGRRPNLPAPSAFDEGLQYGRYVGYVLGFQLGTLDVLGRFITPGGYSW